MIFVYGALTFLHSKSEKSIFLSEDKQYLILEVFIPPFVKKKSIPVSMIQSFSIGDILMKGHRQSAVYFNSTSPNLLIQGDWNLCQKILGRLHQETGIPIVLQEARHWLP